MSRSTYASGAANEPRASGVTVSSANVGSTPSRVVGFDGGYAEYMLAPIEHLVALPDEIGLAQAAPLPCAGLTTYTGFRKAALAPGQRTVVIGVGGPGHLTISIGAAFGGRVYAVTSSRNKVQDALERGAALAGSAEDVARRLHDDGGAEVVLNTVDDLGPLATIMTEVAIGAKIVLAAAADTPLPIERCNSSPINCRSSERSLDRPATWKNCSLSRSPTAFGPRSRGTGSRTSTRPRTTSATTRFDTAPWWSSDRLPPMRPEDLDQ